MQNCTICNFNLKKINEFVFKCEKCLFLCSNLKPGYGREIEGINTLRKENFIELIKVIKYLNISKKLKILEIGSGNGHFIEECIKNKIDITGSEVEKKDCENLKKKFPQILQIKLPIENLSHNKFDKFNFIIFNDVFEHLENLDLVINQLDLYLDNNGKILINLPSSDGIIFKFSNFLRRIGIKNFYNRLWQKDLSSPHLSYFNNSNLKLLFKKHGYNSIYSNSLNTVTKTGNFKRLNSTIKNIVLCHILNFIIIVFFFLQKIFPRDIIFHIFEKKNK